MYDIKPNLIIGFHGCDRDVRDTLLMNPNQYKISQKSFDCDLLEQKYIRLLAQYADSLKTKCEETGEKYPQNQDLTTDLYKNRILRNLDCAVIEFMHDEILNLIKSDIDKKGYTKHKIFDSTRGAFIEGGPAFEGAGIHEKTHIQQLYCLPHNPLLHFQTLYGVAA